jgi:hypothetical protein
MTNKDKTGTARQQARRQREKEWLMAHGYTSWEKLHTDLMKGTVALDKITPAYSKRTKMDELYDKLHPQESQIMQTIIQDAHKKKGKKS